MRMPEPISAEKLNRHLRFWDKLTPGEGGYISVVPCRPDIAPNPLPVPKNLEEAWLSSEYALRQTQNWIESHVFLQDAIPTHFVNLGPGVMAPMLGSGYSLQPTTVWFDTAPIISDFEHVPELTLNREHRLYQVVKDQIDLLSKESNGVYKVSFTDIGGTLDILASLRGNQDLLMDVIDYSDEIAAVCHRIDELFIEYFNEQAGWLREAGVGFTNWIGLVHEKTWYPLQCDFSTMISPAMFEKLVLPSLEYTSSQMDTSLYHLDGPEEIRHLDMILSVPNIHSIQWVPLPGTLLPNGSTQRHFDDEESIEVYRRTLSAGKKLVLLGVPPHQITDIYRAVGTSDGIFISTDCSDYDDAKDLVDSLRRDGWIRP